MVWNRNVNDITSFLSGHTWRICLQIDLSINLLFPKVLENMPAKKLVSLLKYMHPSVSAVPALSNPDSGFDSHRGQAIFQLAQCGNTGGNTQSNIHRDYK